MLTSCFVCIVHYTSPPSPFEFAVNWFGIVVEKGGLRVRGRCIRVQYVKVIRHKFLPGQ
jgi:hypothetical protein